MASQIWALTLYFFCKYGHFCRPKARRVLIDPPGFAARTPSFESPAGQNGANAGASEFSEQSCVSIAESGPCMQSCMNHCGFKFTLPLHPGGHFFCRPMAPRVLIDPPGFAARTPSVESPGGQNGANARACMLVTLAFRRKDGADTQTDRQETRERENESERETETETPSEKATMF